MSENSVPSHSVSSVNSLSMTALQMLHHFCHKWTNRDNTSTLWHQAEHRLLDTLAFSQRGHDV